MTNEEKYNLAPALAAYNGEMAARDENGIDGLPFEDWATEEVGTTTRLIDETRKAAEEEAKAAEKTAEEEKDFIRKAIPALAAHYKLNGWDEAETLLKEITELDPKRDIFSELNSACNCFHSGMYCVVENDFDGALDMYLYGKKDDCIRIWRNVHEWYKYMLELAGDIQSFVYDAKQIVAELRAKKD